MPRIARSGDGQAEARRTERPLRWLQTLPPPSKDLPHKQWAVLVRLALAMNRDGTGWVSGERLAAEANASADTVGRAIKWARETGLLERVSRGHRITGKRRVASTYRLLRPDPNTASNAELANGANTANQPTQHRIQCGASSPYSVAPTTFAAPRLGSTTPLRGAAPQSLRDHDASAYDGDAVSTSPGRGTSTRPAVLAVTRAEEPTPRAKTSNDGRTNP